MPINVYTGLMRSGKSYEVVSEVIVPAIRQGRDVVTNVDGISEERIHEYLKKVHPDDEHGKYGRVRHVTNADVFGEKFLPYYDDDKAAHIDTVVQPGDLVAIDEAWRFWGTSQKIHKNHQSFILEHGHFTHPTTGVACDMVLMIQDMGTLHRFVKNVVAFSFRTTKKVSLGMGNTYSLNMYEGKSLNKANHIGNWVRKYRSEIFPLYSSFKGGAQGVLVNADKRQNVLRNWKTWAPFLVCLVIIAVAVPKVWKFFHPEDPKAVAKAKNGPAGASIAPAGGSVTSQAPAAPRPDFSDSWRICGSYYAQSRTWVVVCNAQGATRVESPSMFRNDGIAQIGEIDGQKVTRWSGAAAPRDSRPAPASHAPQQGALGEIRK